MEFRPCIDIHNGKVKQIVGSSLKDDGDYARENFVAGQDAAYYAGMYKQAGLYGGHVILLNAAGSPYYESTKAQALSALRAFPGGLQVGGGINADNAQEFLDAGASHVIVTSYVFREGRIDYERLGHLRDTVGREHLVLDLSCRRKPSLKSADVNRSGEVPSETAGKDDSGLQPVDESFGGEVTSEVSGADNSGLPPECEDYYIVTDRWQKYTEEKVTGELLDFLASYCSEFLIHAVDVEGKNSGIEAGLAGMLGQWGKIPITYAGGVRSLDDIKLLGELGCNRLNVTIGSALDIFGGKLPYNKVVEYCKTCGT